MIRMQFLIVIVLSRRSRSSLRRPTNTSNSRSDGHGRTRVDIRIVEALGVFSNFYAEYRQTL
eukprot:348486-Rhodomonas_salina.1